MLRRPMAPRSRQVARASHRFAGAAFVLGAGCATPDERSDAWSYLHAAVIAPNCATSSCHSAVSSLAGFDLSTRTSAYAVLTGRTCGAPEHPQDPAGSYVIPFDPRSSQLVQMLRGNYREAGNVLLMPPEQPLASVEIEMIEAWIAAGAPCD